MPAAYYSRAGVRDGIIADLAARNVGAELSRLSRDQRREVEHMGRRYGVSLEHARQVAGIANALFTALEPLHQLPPACGKLLEAAAYLLDVGHFVSATSHHKHSYLCGVEFGPGGLHRTGEAARSPACAATIASRCPARSTTPSSRFRRRSGACCC